jgi:hypothetical protein
MNENTIKIRFMQADDFDAVAEIDRKVLSASRTEYYELKFEKLFNSKLSGYNVLRYQRAQQNLLFHWPALDKMDIDRYKEFKQA